MIHISKDCNCRAVSTGYQDVQRRDRGHQSLSLSSFIDIATTSLIRLMLSYWSIESILMCSKTSSRIRQTILNYMSYQWNLKRHFKSWFREDLKSILHRCNAIISGSQALQFFNRERYLDSDTDFFVRLGGVRELSDWLQQQGYVIINSDKEYYSLCDRLVQLSLKCATNETTFERSILGVIYFVKAGENERDRTVTHYRVQIVIVDADPIEHILYDFHSSKFKLCGESGN